MSGLLEKIFLGNVNEKGEVDQEGYDEDTKRGLTAATSKNKDVSLSSAPDACSPGRILIFGARVADMCVSPSCSCVILCQSPALRVPQSIVGDVVTENDKRVNEDDDTIQRDPHAVDYSRHALFPRNHPARHTFCLP